MKHKIQSIHFVGIGGAGMSGIAEVLFNKGFTISGSDLGDNAATQRLRSLGVQVFKGHEAHQVNHADCVVTSTAVQADNPEVVQARARRIPVVPRAVMLAELMRFQQGIAVAGTHGKTTTTSLIASILAAADMDPTFVIGGRLTSAGANARLGRGDYIVVEADESDASFLNLLPTIAVITNIDADHMDTYEHDFSKLKDAFVRFTDRLPFYGSVVACSDDAHVREILPKVSRQVLSYGFDESAQFRAVDVVAEGAAMRFIALREGEAPLAIKVNMPGRHNVLNALAAVAVATELGVPDAAIASALEQFTGVGRRFTAWGQFPSAEGGVFTLIDDYGHHPVEMAATIAAARGAFPGQRLVLAFQPHRYTRTRDLFEDFTKVLSTVDALLLAEVYPAGEAPIAAADGRALARSLRVAGQVEPIFIEHIDEMLGAIQRYTRDGDVVITMGAGSIGGIPAKVRDAAQASLTGNDVSGAQS